MKQLTKLTSVLKRDPYPLNLIIDFGMDSDACKIKKNNPQYIWLR